MRRLCSTAAGICPVTARSLQGMAPYPGQARCLALGFWPECFRRLNVKGGRRPFPEETRSALDIEGKHVTIQGPSPDLSPTRTLAPSARMPTALSFSRTIGLESVPSGSVASAPACTVLTLPSTRGKAGGSAMSPRRVLRLDDMPGPRPPCGGGEG